MPSGVDQSSCSGVYPCASAAAATCAAAEASVAGSVARSLRSGTSAKLSIRVVLAVISSCPHSSEQVRKGIDGVDLGGEVVVGFVVGRCHSLLGTRQQDS